MSPDKPTSDKNPIPRPSSLILLQSRLHSRAGWRDLPALHAGLCFPLFGLFSMASRIVTVEDRTFQLWSPNSEQSPYYPGVARVPFDPRVSLPSRSRRRDGSLGRFDPTVAPQLFQANAPYWGLLRRAERVVPTDSFYWAYAPIVLFWRVSSHNLSMGVIATGFVDGLSRLGREVSAQGDVIFAGLSPSWQLAATSPPSMHGLSAEVDRLRAPALYQDALDSCILIQRMVRLRIAWTEWISSIRGPTANVLTLRRMISAADESYMGFWINGGNERWSLTLMHLKVPGFVLHEFMSGETNVPTSDRHDFLEDSTTLVEDPFYDNVLSSRNSEDPILLDNRGSAPLLSREELWMSSSWFAQGPRVSGTPLPAVIPPTPVPLPPRPSTPPSRQARPSSAAAEEDNESDYGDRSPKAPPVAEGIEWIQPPDIQATTSKAAWEKWQYDEPEKTFTLLGKRNKDVEGRAYFDRKKHRRLYIRGHDMPEGVWDPRNFGLPVPEGDFLSRSGNKWQKNERSQWMYLQEHPSEDMPAGTSASLPERVALTAPTTDAPPGCSVAEDLPTKNIETPLLPRRPPPPVAEARAGLSETQETEPQQEEEEPARPREGKGKAKWTDDDERMQDGEVEEERKDDRSVVVVLDGLDRALDVNDYMAAVAEDLRQAEIQVYSAMNGQQRIWLQLFDLEAAGRARTVLPTGGSRDVIASFATLEEYTDHWPYAASQWELGTNLPLSPSRPQTQTPPAIPEDDMVSLGATPPPDDCLMIDYPIVEHSSILHVAESVPAPVARTSSRSSSPIPKPVARTSSSCSSPIPKPVARTSSNCSGPIPNSRVPVAPQAQEPSRTESQRRGELTSIPAWRFNVPRLGDRLRNREFHVAPTFHDAPIWGADSRNSGRKWLDDALALPSNPALEYRLSSANPARVPNETLRARGSEAPENHRSERESTSRLPLAARLETPGPSSRGVPLRDRLSDPNEPASTQPLRNRMEGALRARLSKRAVIPGTSSARKTKRGTSGGVKNRLRKETATRRRREDAVTAAERAVARRLLVILAFGGSPALPISFPLLHSIFAQGLSAAENQSGHMDEDEGDRRDTNDDDDFDMDD